MLQRNQSMVEEFILLGLSQNREIQFALFFLFLLFYSVILPGNLPIILTIQKEPQLNSPMYFFLANLAFLDLCYCSITPPKKLADFFSSHKTISYKGCILQIFFLHLLGGSEIILLIGMAIDCYVAICHPLHYTSLISKAVCYILVLTSWCIGFMHSIIQVTLILPLPFCGPNELNNFFCDVTQIIKLACTDTDTLEYIMFFNSGLASLMCFILLLISYGVLLVKVRANSNKGKSKAVSTCITHIIIIIFIAFDKVVAVFHTVIFPLMNPIIYTLRNKEIKQAMLKLFGKIKVQSR
uniref:G-protein coupled receptors family 1 profile domain-containing protein n=1 Tax=Naja naja TaxID=35670 RepID=A0A8C7DYV0_NAJNA